MKNFRPDLRLISFLSLFIFAIPGVAIEREGNNFSFGTYQSYKGFGLSLTSNNMHSVAVFFDMEGVFQGSTIAPGIRGTYLYRCPLKELAVKSGEVFKFYAGPGISGGYIRQDFTFGAFGAVAIGAGTSVLFKNHISIALEFQADLGFFCARNDVKHTTELFFYKKGVQHAYFPQLRIEYEF